MKLILTFILGIIYQISYAQAVTITPSQGSFNTSSSNAVTLKSNASTSYMTFVPNNAPKGYVGVFSGGNNVDLGTSVSNATGQINLAIQSKIKVIVTNDGTLTVVDLASSNTKLLKVNSSGTLTTEPMNFVQNVSFAAFRPAAIDVGIPVNFTTNGDGTSYCASGTAALFAPVDLPDGATITQVRAYFIDNSTDKNIKFELTRNSVTALSYTADDFISEITSSTYSSSLQYLDDTTMNPVSNVINNSNYLYFVRVYLPAGWDGDKLRVKGIIINYQY